MSSWKYTINTQLHQVGKLIHNSNQNARYNYKWYCCICHDDICRGEDWVHACLISVLNRYEWSSLHVPWNNPPGVIEHHVGWSSEPICIFQKREKCFAIAKNWIMIPCFSKPQCTHNTDDTILASEDTNCATYLTYLRFSLELYGQRWGPELSSPVTWRWVITGYEYVDSCKHKQNFGIIVIVFVPCT